MRLSLIFLPALAASVLLAGCTSPGPPGVTPNPVRTQASSTPLLHPDALAPSGEALALEDVEPLPALASSDRHVVIERTAVC